MLVTAGTPASSRDDGCKGIPATARTPVNSSDINTRRDASYNRDTSNSRGVFAAAGISGAART
jgi:hypothetical protein